MLLSGINEKQQFSKYAFDRKPVGLPDCSPMPTYQYDDEKLRRYASDMNLPVEVRKNAYMVLAVNSKLYEAMQHYKEKACESLDTPAVPLPRRGHSASGRVEPRLFGTRLHRERMLQRNDMAL